MKRRLLALALCLAFVCGTALAERQLYADQDGLRVFVEDGKAGLLDAAGQVLLDAEYDYIEPFDGADYAVVSRDGLKGVVFRDGSLLQLSALLDWLPQSGLRPASSLKLPQSAYG